jgi:hypothetical protein
MKKERGIPYMDHVYCVMLEPDMWDVRDIPLGLRRFVDLSQRHCEKFSAKDKLVTRVHSSKLWPPTVVIDDKATEGVRIKMPELRGQLMIDFLNVVGLRLKHNIGDIVERNFMMVDGEDGKRVLSVDEEVTHGRDVSLLDCVKKKNYDIIKKAYYRKWSKY